MRLMSAFLLFSLATAPQQVGQNAPMTATGQTTFRASSQLVVETVIVKDKNDNPVEGLTEKDFLVTEDGVPQTIQFFEAQKLPETPDAVPLAAPLPPKLLDKLPRTQISPEQPGRIRYSDHRLLALYFDMTAMPPMDQYARIKCCQEVCPNSDDRRRSNGHYDVFRRCSANPGGFHGRSGPAAEHHSKP